jgi:hypothetical protein
MSVLFAVVWELLGSGLSSSTERGLVASFTTAAVVLASITLWFFFTHSRPIAYPLGLGAFVASLAIGGAALLTSVLHLSRNSDDRAFGVVCLTANVAALLVPIAGIIPK